MKKIILVVLTLGTIGVLASCESQTPQIDKSGVQIEKYDPTYMRTVTLPDGCEYIYWAWGNATWGSHKGTCKNPIHQKVIHDTLYLDAMEDHSKLP